MLQSAHASQTGAALQNSPRERLAAIALICVAVACFSALDATAKYLAVSANLPVAQIIWLRFAFHLPFALAALGPALFLRSLRSARPGHQMARGLFMAGATGFNFAALQFLQLDETAAIFYLSPLIVVCLAWPVLGERAGWRIFAAAAAGFGGMLAIVRPDAEMIQWPFLLALAAALSYAFYSLYTRYLSRFDPPSVTLIYTPLTGLLVLAPFALAGWAWPASWMEWALCASLGLSGGLGHWLLIKAHAMAPAATLAPFVYVNLFFMAALGYALFGDAPEWRTLAGSAVIIASGLFVIREQTRRAPG